MCFSPFMSHFPTLSFACSLKYVPNDPDALHSPRFFFPSMTDFPLLDSGAELFPSNALNPFVSFREAPFAFFPKQFPSHPRQKRISPREMTFQRNSFVAHPSPCKSSLHGISSLHRSYAHPCPRTFRASPPPPPYLLPMRPVRLFPLSGQLSLFFSRVRPVPLHRRRSLS